MSTANRITPGFGRAISQTMRGMATDADLDLLGAELDRLRSIEERAIEVSALGLPNDSPHLRPGDIAGSHVRAARHILGEPA